MKSVLGIAWWYMSLILALREQRQVNLMKATILNRGKKSE